ncbi:MAG: ATP-binding cassette domain-containing protein [Clostridiaceae bacterium]|nr:ATP-binding cassette domain-containing protein [Clostridiaceae bacterium]
MIEIKNLTKKYGNHVAVDNISFTVEKGEILGFLGPNGAGKSTTMNIITGYLPSTEGTVTIDGYDILEQPFEAKKRIGYLPEQPPLYMEMTVAEYLDFVMKIKKVKQKGKSHIDDIMSLVQIGDVKNRLIKNLSKGYRQRVGLAQALIGNPEVLILDEPTVGLDPKQIIDIRNVIKDLGKEHTIILSSHILPEVSAICERVIIINKGKIAAIDTPENLSQALTNERKLIVRVAGEEKQVMKCIQELEGVRNVEVQGQEEPDAIDYIIESEPGIDIRKPLFYVLSKNQFPILMLKPLTLSLEEIFLQLITSEKEVINSDSNI